jgi:hypothetical protein
MAAVRAHDKAGRKARTGAEQSRIQRAFGETAWPKESTIGWGKTRAPEAELAYQREEGRVVDVPSVSSQFSENAHKDLSRSVTYNGTVLEGDGIRTPKQQGDIAVGHIYTDLRTKMGELGETPEGQHAALVVMEGVSQTFDFSANMQLLNLVLDKGLTVLQLTEATKGITTEVKDRAIEVSVTVRFDVVSSEYGNLKAGSIECTRSFRVNIASGESESMGEAYTIIPASDDRNPTIQS